MTDSDREQTLCNITEIIRPLCNSPRRNESPAPCGFSCISFFPMKCCLVLSIAHSVCIFRQISTSSIGFIDYSKPSHDMQMYILPFFQKQLAEPLKQQNKTPLEIFEKFFSRGVLCGYQVLFRGNHKDCIYFKRTLNSWSSSTTSQYSAKL